METALILISLVFGAYAGWRMLGRAVRVVWTRCVSNVFVQNAWAWVVSLGVPDDDYVTMEAQPGSGTIAGTPDRNAGNAPTERPTGNPVPINRSALFARILSTLPEDELIDTLAQMTNPDGSWRYAESRIGKFAPGRLEDRIEQVRRIRGTDPAPKPPPGPQFEQVGPNSFRRVEGT